MIRRVVLIAVVIQLGACHSCVDDSNKGGPPPPPMPHGMLTPPPFVPAKVRDAAAGKPEDRLAIATTKQTDAFEIAVTKAEAGGSRWISSDAMALLHDSFATTHHGFNPVLPQEIPPGELVVIAPKLERLAKEWKSVASLAVAKERWERADIVTTIPDGEDGAWLRARDAFAKTLDELIAIVGTAGKTGATLRIAPSS